MGSKSGGKRSLTMSDLPDLLGDAIPDMPLNAVGRHRLVSALKNRFGSGWRNIPGVSDIVKDFDEKVDLENRIARIKQIKYKGKK